MLMKLKNHRNFNKVSQINKMCKRKKIKNKETLKKIHELIKGKIKSKEKRPIKMRNEEEGNTSKNGRGKGENDTEKTRYRNFLKSAGRFQNRCSNMWLIATPKEVLPHMMPSRHYYWTDPSNFLHVSSFFLASFNPLFFYLFFYISEYI